MPVAPARADRQADRVEASVLHAVRGVLGRWLSGPRALPWAVLACAAVLAAVDPAATGTLAPWPFVVALAVFGMPHGAADWEVSARLAGRHGFVRRCVGFVPYMALMLACTAALVLAPGPTAVAFLGLTVVHFGMEDADSLHAAREGRVSRWSLAVGRGLLLVCTVFAAHPDEAWAPFAEIGNALAPWSAVRWTIDPPAMRGAALLGCGVGVALSLLGAGVRAFHGQRREAVLDIAEGVLVAFVALQADPLFAIGTYFIGVHAFRHCASCACTCSACRLRCPRHSAWRASASCSAASTSGPSRWRASASTSCRRCRTTCWAWCSRRNTSRTVIKAAPQPAQHRAMLLQFSPRAISSAG